jgi:flavin-dependent dehydrogenase
MAGKEILVVGAGPAGLVAAINLQREGFKVLVREREKRVGGHPGWHPSAHDTPVAIPKIWDYIGIDCSPCFKDCSKNFRFFFGKEELGIPDLEDPLYAVERGFRETSLDSFLFRIAEKEGVDFEFDKPFTEKEFKEAPKNTIMATGLTEDTYKYMGIRYSTVPGYWAGTKVDPDDVGAAIYFGGFSTEYGYSSSINGIWYVLLFSLREIPDEALEEFKELVYEKEGRSFDKWRLFRGYAPKSPKLFFEDRLILTGTLAGVIEPIIGFGITGALISGKIAATAVTEPEKGQAEFDKITRGLMEAIARKKEPGFMPMFKMGDLWFQFPEPK